MASYNTKTINQWYRDKKATPSTQQEYEFWENVFVYEPEIFVRTTIVRYDLGHVLQQYLNQRHVLFAKQLQTHPSYVQAHMECWWSVVCTRDTPKCAEVLHNFFSQPHTAMASHNRQTQRIEDMINARLWDLALNSLSPNIALDTTWSVLEKIMSNDGNWIKKNEWSAVVKHLCVYASQGCSFDLTENKFYQHILNTPWMTDLLILPRYEKQRNKMLKQLFRLGVNFTNIDFNATQTHAEIGATIQLAWNEHNKENLLKTVQSSGCSPIKRKI